MKSSDSDVTFKKIIENYIFTFTFLWKNSKSYICFSFADIIINSLYVPLSIVVISQIFVLIDDGAKFKAFIYVFVIYISISILFLLWRAFSDNCLLPLCKYKLNFAIQKCYMDKLKCIELDLYDNPSFYNDLILAMSNSEKYISSVMNNLAAIVKCMFSLLSIFGIVIYINSSILIVMCISTTICFFVSLKLNEVLYKKQLDLVPIDRRDGYIDRVHRLGDYAKELRVSEMGEALENEYDNVINDKTNLTYKYVRAEFLLKGITILNSILMYTFILLLSLNAVLIESNLALGGFVAIVNAAMKIESLMKTLIDSVSVLPTQSKMIDKIRLFLEIRKNNVIEKQDVSLSEFEYIEFKDVSFSYYDGTPALDKVNFRLNKGDKIAIVGYNGAGKSTLIKLMMGLYYPTSGQIVYNGLDVRAIDINEYRKKISSVFQDYKIFAVTIAENILCDTFQENKSDIVHTSIQNAKFDEIVKKAHDGIHTIVTKEFTESGLELSGGERQKLAIARLFGQHTEIAILDEPSSSLDPTSEYELSKLIYHELCDQTVVMISHRLATTRDADYIYVLEKGNIIEQGTHNELMNINGKYAEMFTTQANKYKNS